MVLVMSTVLTILFCRYPPDFVSGIWCAHRLIEKYFRKVHVFEDKFKGQYRAGEIPFTELIPGIEDNLGPDLLDPDPTDFDMVFHIDPSSANE